MRPKTLPGFSHTPKRKILPRVCPQYDGHFMAGARTAAMRSTDPTVRCAKQAYASADVRVGGVGVAMILAGATIKESVKINSK